MVGKRGVSDDSSVRVWLQQDVVNSGQGRKGSIGWSYVEPSFVCLGHVVEVCGDNQPKIIVAYGARHP